jgi:hypothetical protein
MYKNLYVQQKEIDWRNRTKKIVCISTKTNNIKKSLVIIAQRAVRNRLKINKPTPILLGLVKQRIIENYFVRLKKCKKCESEKCIRKKIMCTN